MPNNPFREWRDGSARYSVVALTLKQRALKQRVLFVEFFLQENIKILSILWPNIYILSEIISATGVTKANNVTSIFRKRVVLYRFPRPWTEFIDCFHNLEMLLDVGLGR